MEAPGTPELAGNGRKWPELCQTAKLDKKSTKWPEKQSRLARETPQSFRQDADAQADDMGALLYAN